MKPFAEMRCVGFGLERLDSVMFSSSSDERGEQFRLLQYQQAKDCISQVQIFAGLRIRRYREGR